jgi:DNA-binding response OmpR family regulator
MKPVLKSLSANALAAYIEDLENENRLLIARVHAVEALVASQFLRHGHVELNRLTRTCSVNGRPLLFTGHEHEVLVLLMLNQGTVLSTAYLTDHVWQGKKMSAHILRVYINILRRKIGPGIIRTVRGTGYTIDLDDSLQNSNVWKLIKRSVSI